MSCISDEIHDTTASSTTTLAEASKTTTALIDELPVNKSWLELVMEDLENDSTIDSVHRMEISDLKRPHIKVEPRFDAGVSNQDEPLVKLEPKPDPDSIDREIAVEFLDVSNEAKYERLIKDEKIKTPFKRRLSGNSNESRSSSPLSMQSTDEAARTAAVKNANKNVPKKTRYDPNYHRRDSTGSGESGSRLSLEIETCEEVLSRRQKQIDYGKNTVGYDKYVEQVPKKDRTKDHPWTPPKRTKYSRRAWDGLVRVWRKKLHCWDPEGAKEEAPEEDNSDTETADDIKAETEQ